MFRISSENPIDKLKMPGVNHSHSPTQDETLPRDFPTHVNSIVTHIMYSATDNSNSHSPTQEAPWNAPSGLFDTRRWYT
jgi:hypothetical protein